MQFKTKVKLTISIALLLTFGFFGFTKASQTQIDFNDQNKFNLQDQHNLKVDSNGGSLKKDRYVLDKINNLGGSSFDYFYSLIETDNHYIAAGNSQSDLTSLGGNSNSGNDDFIIARFNKSDLTLDKINNFGGSSFDYFYSLIETDNHYIAAGYSQSDLTSLGGNTNSGGNDFVMVRINKSDLTLDKINNFGGSGHDQFWSLLETDNYYIAAGDSASDLTSFGGNANSGSTDFVIARINKSDLSLDKINNFGGSSSEGFRYFIETDNHYIAAGYSQSDLTSLAGNTNSGGNDFVIVRINKSDLSLESINNFGGSGHDNFYSLIETDNYYIAAGRSSSDLTSLGGNANSGSTDFVIARINKSDLTLDKINNFGGSSNDIFWSLIETDNYYIAAGFSQSDLTSLGGNTNSGGNDFVMVRINKSDLSLESINNFGGSGYDQFWSLLETDNYYIAAGYSSSDLTPLGGNANSGSTDFVISSFKKIYSTDPYYLTTNSSSSLDIESTDTITGITINQQTPSSTSIKYLISFDKGKTFMKWNGINWEKVCDDSDLGSCDVQNQGMSKEEIESLGQDAFVGVTSLDFLIGLDTDDQNLTPLIQSIIVDFLDPELSPSPTPTPETIEIHGILYRSTHINDDTKRGFKKEERRDICAFTPAGTKKDCDKTNDKGKFHLKNLKPGHTYYLISSSKRPVPKSYFLKRFAYYKKKYQKTFGKDWIKKFKDGYRIKKAKHSGYPYSVKYYRKYKAKKQITANQDVKYKVKMR